MSVYPHDDFNDYILVEVEIHDLRTGSNWIVEIFGTLEEVCRQWQRAERLLARAGSSSCPPRNITPI